MYKFRKEVPVILDMLKHYNYVCVWQESSPRVVFKKGDGAYTIERYLDKFTFDGVEIWLDGSNEEQSDL